VQICNALRNWAALAVPAAAQQLGCRAAHAALCVRWCWLSTVHAANSGIERAENASLYPWEKRFAIPVFDAVLIRPILIFVAYAIWWAQRLRELVRVAQGVQSG